MTVFSEILKKYGDAAVVSYGDGSLHNVKAFVQPVIRRTDGKEPHIMTRLGETDTSRYYYFGPPDVSLGEVRDTYVVYSETKYDVVKAEMFRINGKNSHWEAVLKRREGNYHGGA